MERDVGWNFSNGLTGRDHCCHKTTTWNVKIESLCSPQFCFCNRNTPCFFSIAWVNHQQPRSLWGLPKTCCFQIFGTDCTPGGYRESVALWNAELNRRDLNPIPSFWSWKQWYGRTCTTGQSAARNPRFEDGDLVWAIQKCRNLNSVYFVVSSQKHTKHRAKMCL